MEKIIDWENTSPKQVEIPFKPARVLLQVNTLWIVSVGTCHYHNVSEKWIVTVFVHLVHRILLGYLLLLIWLA